MIPEISASSVSGNHFLKSEDIKTPEKTPWSYPNQAMDAESQIRQLSFRARLSCGVHRWGEYLLALTMVMRTMSHVPSMRSLRDSMMKVQF